MTGIPVPSGDSELRTCDDVAAALRALRAAVGQPSFAQIAGAISAHRIEQGVPAEVAQPGRTTVYDAFRDGRRRIDPVLVGEIVIALGGDKSEARAWAELSRMVGPGDTVADPAPATAPFIQLVRFPRTRWVVAILAAVVALNLFGRLLVVELHLPLHLDMVGTAIAAITLGPWWGALAGILTNVLGVGISGSASLPFTLVQIVGALLWGYGVRRGWGETFGHFFALNIGVAVGCTLVAAPILVFMFGGEVGHASDTTTDRLIALTHSLAFSVLSSNLLTSIADKVISGFVALACIEGVASRRRA